MQLVTQSAMTNKILLVDDEPDVLHSLKRNLRSPQNQIFTASSGEEGLSILDNESIDLVISDMRMPGMSGAQFVGKVARKSPKTVRMILSGYSDIESTIQAINEGKVYSFIAKPWKKDALLQTVSMALYTQQLEKEKKELLKVTRTQNKELQQLNLTLEQKVETRTRELENANRQLDKSLNGMEKNYETAIEVFCRMIEFRDQEHAGHSKRVAKLAKAVAETLELSEQECRNIYFAGLLHDIGKIHFSRLLLGSPISALSADELVQYNEHTTLGESLLTPLDHYHSISHFIRHHHERFDGTGFPDKLSGHEIPLGAAILAVAEDFDEARSGLLFDEPISVKEASQMIMEGKSQAYNPKVVAAFLKVIEKSDPEASTSIPCIDK